VLCTLTTYNSAPNVHSTDVGVTSLKQTLVLVHVLKACGGGGGGGGFPTFAGGDGPRF